MNDVIIYDGSTTELGTGNTVLYCGSGFTKGFTIDLKGQTVALGTYPGTSGTITVNDSVGGGSATMTLPEGFTGSFAGTGTLAVTAPASVLPVSGGMDLSSATIAIPDASGTVIASDSVTVGNSGIQVALASTIDNNTVMVKASNIPSSSCRLIGWMTGQLNSKDIENCTYYDGSNFNQCYYLDGVWQNDYNSTGDSRSWTRDASDHWIEISYARANNTGSSQTSGGTRTYFDGSEKVTSTGLKWGSNSTSKITIGGTATSSTSPATGMVIKDIVILSNALTANQMAKVTTALNNGWTVGTAGTALTSSESLHALPGYSNVTAVGTVTVASDGTLDLSGLTAVQVGNGATLDLSANTGLTQVIVLSGGELTIGKQRPGSVAVMEGGTLNVTSDDPTANDLIVGYTKTAELSVEDVAWFTGTVKLDGATVTPSIDGNTATLTGVAVAGNATYTGSGWWWDFEFNGNGNNIGSQNTGLNWDSSRPTASGESAEALGDYTEAVDGNQMVHLLARPWRHVDGASGSSGASGYPAEFTAVMFCKAGTTANGVLVAFGSSNRGSSTKTIALATGDHPENGEMRLVLINGSTSPAEDLVEGGFTLDNITSANHLYAFTVQTVGNVSHITVYADGDLLTTYEADGILALGNGFQIGSIHGSITSEMGLNYLTDGSSGDPDEATMDFLRVSNVALSEAAIKSLAAEYRYVSPNGIAERTLSANATWTDETNTSWSQKTLNQDGSTTTTDQAAPNSGTVVEITASTDVQLTMDLASEVSYEKVTFQGAGAITVKAGGTAPTVTTRTYINTDVTMDIAAFASLGAITVDAGKTLTLVPDETSTLNTGIGLGIRGTASEIVTGTVTLGDGASVVLSPSIVASFADYGFTLTLEADASGRYVYTIVRDDNPVHITKTDGVGSRVTYAMYSDAMSSYAAMFTLPAEPATIPADFASSVTIVNNHASDSLSVATVFAGGTVPVTVSAGSSPVELSGDSTFGGTITLNGDTEIAGDVTISGTVSGTGTLTVSGDVTVASTGSIANTIAGNGTITFEALPASALSFGEWTGTVVLPANQAFEGQKFDDYGIAGSTVRLQGANTGWFYYGAANNTPNRAPVATTIEIPANASLTVTGWSSSFANTFNVLKGSGTFAVNIESDIDISDSSYSAYFLLKDVSNFTGSLSATGAGIAIGESKPAYTTTGGKIYLASDVTLTVPSTSSIAPALTGAGRVVFEGALPTDALKTSLKDKDNWTGTVEIKDFTQPIGTDSGIIKFYEYGNENSAIALNGVKSLMFAGANNYEHVTLREIEIGEGGWSDRDNDDGSVKFTTSPQYTANLTGSGTITVKTGNEGTVKFIGNHTFNGSVAFGANTGKQVAFMKTANDALPLSFTAKAIVVAGRLNMDIASGEKWTAPGGVKIDGSLTVFTAEKATATSVEPTASLDGASLTTTEDDEAGTTTYVTDDDVIQISDNQATLGAFTVSEPLRMTGLGGAFMSSLTINDGATLTYDPVITPIRVGSAPVFNGTGKLKLAPRYAGVTCGKFHLVSYPSAQSVLGTLNNLVDSTSFNNATYTVTEETVGDYKQLVLKVGNYDDDAKEMTIAQFGDSITEGIIRGGYRGTPNYRIPLMQLLEAYGYKPEAKGYRKVGSTDANGVPAHTNYMWHTGISAQRIYTGWTGSSYFRAGFMESIEAHLEQVGVTDIITLKIGTNDSIGGESAANMFEGWSNLVWKVVNMRPTSKIVVCAPVKIRSGENNAPGLRTKIAEYVAKTAAQGGFPDGQVTMINGFDVVTDDANYYLTDGVHPNWNGHLQLANAWLPAVTNAFESMANRATVGYTAQTAASAETVTELADYRAGYVKLATFTNVFTKVSTWDEPPYTWVNNNFKNKEMARVAYFVARKTTASPDTRYVWVDMDADATTGTTLAQFCVPTNAAVNGVVNNIHIYSNSSAIENVAPDVSGVKGTLMRTEKSVSGAAGIEDPNAPAGVTWDGSKDVFDWNDSIDEGKTWGVMSVARKFDGASPTNHRKLLAAQMLFDFNGFNGSRQNALGIGDFAVHGPYNYANSSVDNFNLNWTFTTDKDEMPTMDARALESGVIEIWGKPVKGTGTIFLVY